MTAELLARYNVCRTDNALRSQEQLSRHFCPHVLNAPSAGGLQTVQNIARLGATQLVYLYYGGAVEVSHGCIDDHDLLILPRSGYSEIVLRGGLVNTRRGMGTLIPAGCEFSIRTKQGTSALIWRLHRDALEGAVGVHPAICRARVEADPSITLSNGPGAALARTLYYTARELDVDRDFLGSARAIDLFERALIAALLDGQRNWTAAAPAGSSGIAPACVRRVEAYILANAGEPIAAENLVEISGVSARTLFRNFRTYRGVTPMEYLRAVRLRGIRCDLLTGGGTQSVTDVASRWGVTQFGRMAALYRDRYGERPSDTLRASRSAGELREAAISSGEIQ